MGLEFKDMLVSSKSPFYGIVPGNEAHPLGTVVLPVTFGTRENYCTDFIKFEVANFESSYHAILGRPALAKFMAVLHYVYLLLKMPGLSGVLTLRGDLKKSYDCNQEAIQYALTTQVPDALGEVLVATQQLSQSGLEIPSRKASKSSIQLTEDVALKTIQLQEGDSSKTAVIGAGLGEK
jgi:ribonuclease HI